MEWCFGSGIDDLVVPEDQELSDRFPPPESWPKWEINAPGNMELQIECFILNTNFTLEELDLSSKILYNQVEMESPISAKDESCSSVCGGSSQESIDYQLDELSRFQQMDDIFLNSLLEDLPGSEDIVKPYSHSPDNSLTLKVPPAKIPSPPEKSCINESITPGPSSLGEFVLQELETVMTQLPHKTRICFRDAFFHLANNSQQSLGALNQRRNLSLETEFPTHDAKIRSEGKNGVDVEVPNVFWQQSPTAIDQHDQYIIRNAAGARSFQH